MTYRINMENTGLNSHKDVEDMAETLRQSGYDVQATRDFGQINSPDIENPFAGGEGLNQWEFALILSDKTPS